ncbi:MAG: hypothetical protein JWO59_3273 [Chloroflexi bacterium]|nr:hypothetical protein [Chloroflexota bacterium]
MAAGVRVKREKQMWRTIRLVPVLLVAALALVGLTSRLARAQSPVAELAISRVTLQGPGLRHAVTLIDSPALHILFYGGPPDVLSGGHPAIQRPLDLGRHYQLTQYLRSGTSLKPVDQITYYFSKASKASYFFYRSTDLGWSQPPYDRRWFAASTEVNEAMRRLLAAHHIHN